MRVPAITSEPYRKAVDILRRFPGDAAVLIYDARAGKYVRLTDIGARCEEQLLQFLRDLLGDENVVCT